MPRRFDSPRRWIALVAGFFLSVGTSLGQGDVDVPLRLHGPTPVGARASVTEEWGTLQFKIDNPNATGREARVAVFYPETPHVQYARDIWIPGRSSLTTWLTVGPAPAQKSNVGRELRTLFQDRTGGGTIRTILPGGESPIRSNMILYRKREQTTALIVDVEPVEPGQLSEGLPADLMMLARIPRTEGFSEHISIVQDGPLPLAAEALDGIDVVILAGNRLANDPPGRAALRNWVLRGGRLWAMLDRIDPGTVEAILGESGAITVVDRVGLTSLRLRSPGETSSAVLEVEQPVPFVRVLASGADRELATIDGWPAAFVRRFGRGKIVFTTLGGGGWARPRTSKDGASPFPGFRDFPIPLQAAMPLARELHPTSEPDPFPPEVFQPMLTEEIGYTVVGRGTVAAILGGFVVILAALGLGLRRTARPRLLAAMVLFVCISATSLFAALGERSRQAVPPTIGLAAMVDPLPGGDEAAVTGLYAVYRPTSGSALLGTEQGAALGLDAEGLEGKTRIRVQTDTDVWHWDELSLPAGSRNGTFRAVMKTGRIAALAKFGPTGIEGKLTAGHFGGLEDAILTSRSREISSIRLGTDGAFASGSADVLPPGQFLGGSVLTDRQQRRRLVYGQLHTGTGPRHLEGRDLLMVWADPPDVPIIRGEGVKVVGSMLLTVPLEFERTAPNTPVIVPRGWIPYKRYADGKQIPTTMRAQFSADMRLRFQLPPSVLPLQLEGVTLTIHARTPFRKVTVSGEKEGAAVKLLQVEAPVEPLRIELTDRALLKLDDQGGIYLNIAVGEVSAGTAADTAWTIESISLEAKGRTAP